MELDIIGLELGVSVAEMEALAVGVALMSDALRAEVRVVLSTVALVVKDPLDRLDTKLAEIDDWLVAVSTATFWTFPRVVPFVTLAPEVSVVDPRPESLPIFCPLRKVVQKDWEGSDTRVKHFWVMVPNDLQSAVSPNRVGRR